MKIRKVNRPRKYKDKRSSGCGLCKPHKHGLAKQFKDKERQTRLIGIDGGDYR